MAKGGKREGAGRKAGVPNKDKAALRDMLNEHFPDWDPVIAMAQIASTTDDRELELAACKEVAQYIHPKLKSIEHKGEVQKRIVIVDFDGDSPDIVP